jgi:hypothetical protein
MANGIVVLYFSRFGKPLQTHHKVVLDLGAKAIARIKDCKFGGPYDPAHNYSGPRFFVGVGGASSAELAALAAFTRDPSLKIVRASHVEEYGESRRPPVGAIVEFHGDDPEAGPLLRYTIVTPQDQQLRQKICGRCIGAWRGLPAPVISSDADSRVIRFRSRTDASHRSQRGKAPIGYSGPDYSPVPDLSKYECPESEDDYRHRMVINAVALVFVSLLSLAGFWLVNVIAHS